MLICKRVNNEQGEAIVKITVLFTINILLLDEIVKILMIKTTEWVTFLRPVRCHLVT